ncbi:MAG: TetR/AcrR family transcriptional regulator [Burkholderiaceae bacterium]
MNPSLTRTDWLDAGLRLIGERGPASLRIDVLCRTLGVTKGSFYHHFGGQPEYVTALLAHWKNTYTQQLIHAVADIGDLRQRSKRLSELALGSYEARRRCAPGP